MSKRPLTFVLLAVLILAGMIVSPVCAVPYTITGDFGINTDRERIENVYNMTYNAAEIGHRINTIQFSAQADDTVYFTLFYGTNATVSGQVSNTPELGLCFVAVPCMVTNSTITFGGESKSYSYGDVQPFFDFYFNGYARDEDNQTGLITYGSGYGSYDNDLAVFYPVSNLAVNTIYRVDMYSENKTFSVFIDHASAADIAGQVAENWLDIAWKWINYGIAVSGMVFSILVALGLWAKFFFIDNLTMTVSLYLAITLAYSACTSKSVFQFFRKFFDDQRKLFEFILKLWQVFVDIIASFRSIFKL